MRRILGSLLVLVLLLQGAMPMYAHAESEAPQQQHGCCPDETPADLDCEDICGAPAVTPAPLADLAAVRPTQQAMPIPAGDPGPAYLPLTPPPIS
jgi:hypothetical protein